MRRRQGGGRQLLFGLLLGLVGLGLMLGIGLVTGVFSGVFGVGGGVVLVPILVLLLRYPHIAATGTSLVALLLPVGLLGVLQYYNAGKLTGVEIRSGLVIAVGLFLGTYVGARIALGLPTDVLRKSFSVFLVLIAARLWWH